MLAVSLGLARPAAGGDWTIVPRVDVREGYSSNVRSVPEGEESDLITTATAGTSVVGRGARLNFNFDYSLSRDKFVDNSELNSDRQNLIGSGSTELWQDHLFLDARAAISQESLARSGITAAGDRTLTENESEVVTFTATPLLTRNYGRWATSETFYRYSETRFLETDQGEEEGVAAAAAPQGSRSHELSTLVRSGPKFSRLAWELSTSFLRTHRGQGNVLYDRKADLSGEYVVTREFAVLARIGQQTMDDVSLAEDVDGMAWSAGVRVQPGPRTVATVEYGHQFGDPTWTGELGYKINSLSTISASLTVNLASQQQVLTNALNGIVENELGSLVDPVTGLDANPNDLGFDFIDQVAKTQTFNVNFSGSTVDTRNRFSVNGSLSTRELDANNKDSVANLVGTYSRQMTPNLVGRVQGNLSQTIQTSGVGAGDATLRSNASLTYTISDTMVGILDYNYVRQDSEARGIVQENLISVNLRRTF